MLKLILGLGIFFISLASEASSFVAGKDYEIMPYSPIKSDTNTIKVVEFFSYGCPWCYKLEPRLKSWVEKNNKQFTFQKIPVIFHKEWLPYAKAYHLLDSLSLLPQVSPLIFKSVMEENRPLDSTNKMIPFLQAQGIATQTLESAFENSPSIDMMIQEDMQLMTTYRVNSIPAFLVNHRYKTDLKMAKDEKRLFEILDFLVEESKKKNN